SAEASATTCGCASARSAWASMRVHAAACSCVSSSGRTSMSALAPAVGLVAFGQRRDQAVDAVGVDLLGELAAVGIDQPHPQHVQVVDLPAGALPRRLLQPVFELD